VYFLKKALVRREATAEDYTIAHDGLYVNKISFVVADDTIYFIFHSV
jgi:hypothetical protein